MGLCPAFDHVVDGHGHVVAADLPGQLVGPLPRVLGAVLAAHVAGDEDAVAELLGMMRENAPTFLDRNPLFPGKSCFPLSPSNKVTEERNGFPFRSDD